VRERIAHPRLPHGTTPEVGLRCTHDELQCLDSHRRTGERRPEPSRQRRHTHRARDSPQGAVPGTAARARTPPTGVTLSAMHIATPLTGTRYDTVLRQALAHVRAGDYRARRITLTGAPGVFA